jgi:hypothetical protein
MTPNAPFFPEPAFSGGPAPARRSLFASWIALMAGMRFWTFSALIHLVIVILVGGTVLFKRVLAPPDFAPDGGIVSNDTETHAPPQSEPTLTEVQPTTSATASVNPSVSAESIQAITSSAPAASYSMNAAVTAAPMPRPDALKATSAPAPAMPNGLTAATAKGIAGFTSGWSKRTGGTGSNLKERQFQFTAYLAKYAGGDWDSAVRIENNEITEGCLPNLLFVMSRLSKDKVSGHPETKPLDLSSAEIFEKKPPVIFFTGHRDFVLTEQEIANLRNYIMVGGCLWGDSSLAGQHSRFDIAFRREMKRVIPDLNKNWQEVPATHPIFTRNYFPEVKDVAEGMNFRHEPIYMLPGLANEIGILYTANDYGDMWQFGIDEKGNLDLSRDEKLHMVAVNEVMWWRRNLYFRNIEPKALLKSYKFGMNIMIYLMTRWEDKLGMAARM